MSFISKEGGNALESLSSFERSKLIDELGEEEKLQEDGVDTKELIETDLKIFKRLLDLREGAASFKEVFPEVSAYKNSVIEYLADSEEDFGESSREKFANWLADEIMEYYPQDEGVNLSEDGALF